MIRKFVLLICALALLVGFTACSDDAKVVDENIKKAADNFEINRRLVFVNGITDKYMLEIEGFCNFTVYKDKTSVICKTGKGQYKKHTMTRSDNTFMVSEQLESAGVSAYHYRMTFKPEQIIPDIDLRTSNEE